MFASALGLLCIAPLYPFANILRELVKQGRHSFRLANHRIDDEVDKVEQGFSGLPVVVEVHLTGVDGVISYYSNRIECLLQFYREAVSYQRSDFVVESLA